MKMDKIKNFGSFRAIVFFAGSFAGTICHAATPPSVAVREQTPEVENILKTLETKALAAQGTWEMQSGPQDATADRWEMSFEGTDWSLKSDAQTPSTSTGFLLLGRGEYIYQLPDGIRLQNDTLSRGDMQSFHLGQELLWANWRPRQFLSAIGKFKVIDQVSLNGNNCIHLSADPAHDSALLSDKTISLRTAPLPKIDLYYDPARQAVAQMTVTDPASFIFRIDVTAWDSFSTSSQWPKTVVGNVLLLGSAADAKPIEKPWLVTISRFAARNVDNLHAAQQAVRSVGFFSAPLHDLRSEGFYAKALESGETTPTDRVALAQASFNSGDVKHGLEEWSAVASQLTSADQRNRLRDVLAPHAAYGLWSASRDKTQVDACVALIQKLLRELPSSDLKSKCPSLYGAWEALYTNANTRPSGQELVPELMPIFLADGNDFVFTRLVALQKNKQYTALVAPFLQGLVSSPMPVAGYSGSQQSQLVVAELAARDTVTATDYLRHLTWDPQTQASSKLIVPAILAAIERIDALNAHRDADIAGALASYAEFSDAYKQDVPTSRAIRALLLNSALECMRGLADKGSEQITSLMSETAAVPHASDFWQLEIFALIQQRKNTPQQVLAYEPLLKSYGITFRQPNFEVKTWLTLGLSRKGFLSLQLQYFNKALVSAPADDLRYEAIVHIAQACKDSREYLMGAQAVDGAKQFLKDANYVRKAELLSNSLRNAAAEELVQSQKSAHDRNLEILQAQLNYINSQLNSSKAKGADDADIASLKATADSLTKAISAETASQ